MARVTLSTKPNIVYALNLNLLINSKTSNLNQTLFTAKEEGKKKIISTLNTKKWI